LIAASNVSNVAVTCVTNTFTVGGTVTGLAGSGLVLQNNGADNLARAADGAFTFATPVASGGAYDVTVLTQPATPAQTCTPTNNTGNVAANVANVTITCVTDSTTVGSAIIGPAGGTVNVSMAPRSSYRRVRWRLPSPSASRATAATHPHSRSQMLMRSRDLRAHAARAGLHRAGDVRVPFNPALVPNDADPTLYKAEMAGRSAHRPPP